MPICPPRDDDEKLLSILRQHVVGGLTESEIAERKGMSRSSVCGVIHRIRRADVAESGQDAAPFYRRGACTQGPDVIWPKERSRA